MSLERAKEHLKKYNLDNKVMVFDKSSATVSEAAKAIGCEEREIGKTLSFLVGDQAIVILVAGDSKIDNRKFKDCFNVKAKMIPFEEVEDFIGHAPGGVCPFGVKDDVKVYLDESLKLFSFSFIKFLSLLSFSLFSSLIISLSHFFDSLFKINFSFFFNFASIKFSPISESYLDKTLILLFIK